ncbi:uncharacterized protein LOC109427424 isoform X1 [Aedes albopictus]|uniref:Uncharacterized protein n=1 Tax=Aedes albopictus TaxID=7160 RepID=A0ABM1YES6_AEDAL|nr:uncharacterized protein LOC109427424 isoform X1 [Aedes albopictus]
MSSGFSSVFKINGVPILPPVMTDEVRAEVARYRQMAVQLEQKLLSLKIDRTIVEDAENVCFKDATVDCDQPKEEDEPCRKPEDFSAVLVRRGSFTLEAPSPGLGKLPQTSTTPLKEKQPELVVDSDEEESPRPRLIRSNSYTLDSPSPLLMKHLHNQSLNIKSSASMGEIETGTGKSHVKKLDFGGGGEAVAKKAAKTAHQGAKPKWVSTKKVSPKPLSPVKKYKSPYESTAKALAAANKKKPKQREHSLESPLKRPSKPAESTPLSDCQQRMKEMQAEHERRVKELLKRQEEEQLKLQESFRQQQEELMKMLPMPLLDQIHTSTPLLTSPDESTVGEEEGGDAAKPSFRTLNISSKDFVNNNESQSSIGHASSSRHTVVSSDASRTSLDLENSDELYRTCENNVLSRRASAGGEPSVLSSSSRDANGNGPYDDVRNYLETIGQSLQDDDLKQLSRLDTNDRPSYDQQTRIRHQAASLINAYARGYLTRRLFQTGHVQKMVQVIRDTLLFILDLHHERHSARQQVRSPADVQLKRTLLQQLTSACYQLHEVFFETTVPQRMAIIRRDRDALRRKLENRPRTAGSVGSTVSSRSSVSSSSTATAARKQTNAYRKLQMCSLYSVNIEGEPSNAEETATNEGSMNGSMHDVDPVLPKPREYLCNSAPPSRSSLHSSSSTRRNSPAPSLSATVVSRLVHQMKQAIAPQQQQQQHQQYCQEEINKLKLLRPKTSEAALIGASAYQRRTHWDQKYF